MFFVVDAIGSEISRHRVIHAAGKVACERMALRVLDKEGRDVTYSAKDSVR